ncbi:NUP170 [Malassezia furfur]|nr:NUP170 [Malassezia furfur]
MSEATLERLGAAQKLIAKWCQPGALALPDIKARLPPRDAPYEEHTQADDPWASFSVLRRLPIPSTVFETITSRAPVATLSLFPAIGRACITVENRVYLWDYANGQTAFEYHELPDDQVVLAAGLVAAKPGVFIPEIQHVLVLSTGANAVEGRRVSILGVSLTAEGGVKLYETAMSANTNGVVMRDVQGTDAGRVFMVGSDSCVYELVYQATEGWFSSRCYLYNVTLPRLSNLLPSFFKSEKKLQFLTVDSARSLLYVLRQGDQIDVYSLPSQDSSRAPVHTGSMYGVTHQAGLLHSQQEVGPIVWLGATEPDTRTNVCLIAVTEKGHRIYFDDFQRRSWAQLAVRIPPGGARAQPTLTHAPGVPLLSGMRMQAAPTLRKVTNAFYASGVFFETLSAPDTGPQLYGVATGTPTSYAGAASAVSAWQESATLLPLGPGGSPPVLAEVDARVARRQNSEANGATTRPCAAENMSLPRVFLVLDSNGLTEVVERRPADILASLLAGSLGGAHGSGVASAAPPILDFFNRYGSIEASMTALALAARNTHLTTLPAHLGALDVRTISDEVQAHAIRVFFGPLGSWPADSRMPTTLVSSKSSRFEALACYLATLVRRVWTQRLVPDAWLDAKKAKGTTPAPNPLLQHGELQAALRELGPLCAFMQRHSQLFELGASSEPRAAPAPVGAPPQPSERDDLLRLQALAQRTREACHFVLFLADHGLPAIVQSVSGETRAKLATLRFGDLVATADGSIVANELVNALIEEQSGARASVDAIADALQERCASFCSADDVRRYKASEALRNAVETHALLAGDDHSSAAASERRTRIDDDLQTSLRLLVASATQLPLEKLQQVCATYRELHFSRGVITLALAAARASDAADIALAFRADGCPEEVSHRRTVYQQRRAMYALVLDTLGALDAQLDTASNALVGTKDAAAHTRAADAEKERRDAYALATQSDDPLFHEELYTWLLAHGRTGQLLELHTPFLEEFLQGVPVLLNGESYATYVRGLRDLLWQLHVRRGDFFAAAQTLDELAHADAFALKLSERIEYLALAVGNAKSVRPSAQVHAQEVIGFATQLDEDLEVAQVQAKILGALQPLDTLDWDEEEKARYAAVLAALDSELLDITALYKEAAQPFGLLEQQLLILATAQYQDMELVADLWDALLIREHNASDAEHAHQAVAAMVTDVYTSLGSSDIACPVDIVLPRLEQYALDTLSAVEGDPMTASPFRWTGFASLGASPIEVGWAPLVLLQVGASPEAIFDVLQALIRTAPPPWNTTRGFGFLLPDAAAYLAQWLDAALKEANAMPYFPAHRVDEAANDYILQLNTRKFLRADDALDKRVDQLRAVVQRLQRAF